MLYAFTGASSKGDEKFLLATAIPAVPQLSWVNFRDDAWRVRALESMSKWSSPKLTRKLGSAVECLVAKEMVQPVGCPPDGLSFNRANAFELADMLSTGSVEGAPFASAHVRLAQAEGLPANPAGFGPRAFLRELKRVRVDPEGLSGFLDSASRCLSLRSKQGSLESLASALRAWGEFCDSLGACHFPVDPVRATQFATICRDPGTYGQYLSHVKSDCEILGWPSLWSNDPRVFRAKEGLKKASLVFKGPRLSVGAELARRLALDVGGCTPERFFCLLSWVFLLRANHRCI